MAANYSDERLALPTQFTPGKIGVVTVLYNSAPVLPDFFRSVNRQTYDTFSVYCVDNASADDSVAQCRRQGSRFIVLSNMNNVGVAAGNNQGIRAALADGCEYILLLNNDVVFGPELLQGLKDGLRTHNCSMTSPLMYFHDQPDIIWAAGGHFQSWLAQRCVHSGLGLRDTGQFSQPERIGHAPTCCILFKRQVFEEIGLFDESLFVYGDDNDFTFRALQARLTLFLIPDMKLWHKVSSLTGAGSNFSMRYVARGRAYFIAKHLGRIPGILWTGFYRVYYFARWMFRKDTAEAHRVKQQGWSEGVALNRNLRDG